MSSNLKRKFAIGVAVLASAAFGGGAYAATQVSGSNARQAFLNASQLFMQMKRKTSRLDARSVY